MKTLIGAFALLMAAPVAAQAAPAADPQAEPSQHHSSGAPTEHKMDCKCCDEAKMKDCCGEHAGHAAEHGSHSAK